MSTTDQVVHLFSERLMAAEDKQVGGEWVLRRVNNMKHKGDSRPITFEEKKKIVELVGRKVTAQARADGADSASYTAVINYILENLDGDGAEGRRQSESA